MNIESDVFWDLSYRVVQWLGFQAPNAEGPELILVGELGPTCCN